MLLFTFKRFLCTQFLTRGTIPTLQHYLRKSINYIKVTPYLYFKVPNARNLYLLSK